MERYRTTLILLVVLIVLGGAALFLNSTGGVGTTTPTPTVVPTIYVWQESNPVIGLDVVSGTQKISVSEDVSTTDWIITQPVAERADNPTITGETNLLSALLATGTVSNTGDLAPFGLDKPQMTVTVTFSDTAHTQRVLQVGNPTFDGSGYYVKQASAPGVYIVINTTIEPLRTWPATPPVFVPSPTPAPTDTEVPATVTGTIGITGTVGITGTQSTVPGATGSPTGTGTAANTTTPAAQSSSVPSTPIAASSTITTSVPVGINPTTPVETPVLLSSTATP